MFDKITNGLDLNLGPQVLKATVLLTVQRLLSMLQICNIGKLFYSEPYRTEEQIAVGIWVGNYAKNMKL